MRLSIETSFRYLSRGGVTRYITQLLDALGAVAPDLSVSELCCAIPNFEFKQPRRAMITAYREFLWTPWIAPGILARQKPDIVHMTCFPDIPAPKGIPRVVTLHDLSQLRFPQSYRPYTRWRWKYMFAKMREADAVISVSEFSKREAVELLGIPPERIHVVPLAPGQLSPPPLKSFEIDLPPRFFLFVGSLSPRKNLDLLIRTYELAKMRRIPLPPLVVVGARVEGVRREMTPPHSWRFFGRIDDSTLALLYSRALALIYPSFYEGFGIPLLEAMSAGCPVICSPVASLPEAGGDGACYADQTPDSYLDALVRMEQDPAYRESRILAGHLHSATFSWEKTAKDTLNVYEKLIAKADAQ